MQRLWAPWRQSYIAKLHAGPKACIFCNILKAKDDRRQLVFLRREHAYAVLNLYPYSNGHCLIVTNRHASDINKLPEKEYIGLMDLLKETKDLVEAVLKPHGFNVGINLGRTAGAGIPGHVHVHLVPRWKGDHNFMPVTAGTKVLSQSLADLYKKLYDAHTKRHRGTRR